MSAINFNHTKETLDAKKVFTGKEHINQSGIMTCTISDAKIQGFGSKDKSLSMTLTNEEGSEARFVAIKFIDDDGSVNEKGLDLIRDIVYLTKAKFDGEKAEVFNDKSVKLAIKVVAKKKGKGAGFPQLFVNAVFNSKNLTIKEARDKQKETVTFEYWEKVLAKDEPIIKEKTETTGSNKTMEDRIADAQNGAGAVNPGETPSFDDEEDSEEFPF